MNICKSKDCLKRASYGPDGGKAIFCVTHKAIGHVNVVSKRCSHAGCTRLPAFGLMSGKAEVCAAHRSPNHVDVKHRLCLYKGCKLQPSYGPPGCKAQYCTSHKLAGQVQVVSKRCQYAGCQTIPAYGAIGGKVQFCATHREPDHVDLINKTCEYPGCAHIPVYGKEGNIAQFCVEHKRSDHIDLKSKRCKHEGCKLQPSFGLKNGRAEYCADHKTTGHVDVKHALCIFQGCTRRPSYGSIGGRVEYCVEHKSIGHVDIVSRHCNYAGCTTQPKYGRLFEKKSHCAKHRGPSMFEKNRPKCPCGDNRPCYTDSETSSMPIRCEACKIDGDVNVVERDCAKCGLPAILREDFLDCDDCYTFTNKKPHKQKEMLVKAILDDAELEYLTHDRIPEGACHRYRPDFLFDWGTHVCILECDEDQHRNYACECEQARMINLFQDQGGTPVVFVRFNPDSYKDATGKKREWTAGRGAKLVEVLDQLYNHPPDHVLCAVYLYYDGFDSNAVETIKIDYGH